MRQRPLVPEEHLGPIDPQELRRKRKIARCPDSPTGVHYFDLSKQEDGSDDGPCRYCHKLHSKVHKKSRKQNTNRKGERKVMANMITVNDLAKETGVDGRIIRRILRKSFGGGDKKVYSWDKGDPKLKEIRAAIKNRGTKDEKPAEDKGNKKTPKADKPAETKAGEAGTTQAEAKEAKEKEAAQKAAPKKTGKASTKKAIDQAIEPVS